MKTCVMGDIHGAYKALVQVLKRANFDYANDTLIFLGDIADWGPDTKLCVDELLKIKHLIIILGNHDKWALDWMETGWKGDIWVTQGGQATLTAYSDGVPSTHVAFFEQALPYYIDKKNRLFVHAGFELGMPIQAQSAQTLMWDRTLFERAYDRYKHGDKTFKLTPYEAVFVGHTSTHSFSLDPVKMGDVWGMDQGAKGGGKLTLMDVDSCEFWASDLVGDLYI